MNSKLLLLLILSTQAFAMKSRERTFPQSCDVVWKAAVEVAKTDRYRIVSISKEEQIISLAAGGFLGGERILSVNLSSRSGDGCTATVQSRFSGLVHSDGPDLLRRIYVEVVANVFDRNSKAFRRFKDCMEGPGIGNDQCEERFRKDVKQDAGDSSSPWWQISKPETTK